MAVTQAMKMIHTYYGVSTDTKPTDVPIGSLFKVYDATSKAFTETHEFIGSEWIKQA